MSSSESSENPVEPNRKAQDGEQQQSQVRHANLTDREVRSVVNQLWSDGLVETDALANLGAAKDVLDEAPVGITIGVEQGEDHPLLYVNSAFEKLTGYTEDELLQRDCRFLQGEETDPERVAEISKALQARESVTVELRNYRKDGSPFWNRLTIAPLNLGIDQRNTFVSFQEEVTERRELEEAFRQKANVLRDVTDSMPGVTYELRRKPNGSYQITHMSDGFEQLSGVTSENALESFEQTFRTVHPEDKKRVIESIEASADSLTPWTLEYRYQYGEEVTWVLGSSIPEKRDNGVTVWRGVLIDITDRKQLEQELKNEVRETQRISQLKSDVVARASHDMRTPLNSVIGLSSILEETDLSPSQQRHLNGIQVACQSMLFLVNDILDLDRMESGEMTLQPEPTHIRSLFSETMTLFRTTLEDKDLEFTQEIDEHVPEWIHLDSQRLQQILVNLIGNALKFTRSGRVGVRIDCSSLSEDRVTLRCRVSDTGPGIPEDKRERIFLDRKQGSSTTTFETTGAGLGLSICQQLVELMGGEIGVESEVGEGSTFTFTVRADRPDKEEIPDRASDRPSVDGTRVLVADDNAPCRKLLERLLKDASVEVHTAGSGKEALELLEQQSESPYDTVFLDQRLGEISGTEIITTLRNQTPPVDTKNIQIFTGEPESRILKHVPEDAIAGVLNKPVTESELLNAIHETLDRSSDTLSSPGDPDRQVLKTLSEVSPRILIVDDDQEARRILSIYLSDYSDDICTASTGEEAIRQYIDRPHDVVLTDLQMPGMDGWDVVEHIRNHELEKQLKPTSIIMQTALTAGGTREKSRSAGANALIQKPIDRNELYRKMVDVVSTE